MHVLFQKRIYFFFIVLSTLFTSCLKSDFDQPPTEGKDPNIPTEKIISGTELISKYFKSGGFTDIKDDVYIQGVVTSDDRSGNIFKLLYLQDENSSIGLSFSIDQAELHALFPLKRRVFVLLKGLTIYDSNGTPQIGKSASISGTRVNGERIPSSLVPNHFFGGIYNQSIPNNVKTISQLTPEDLNTLIVLEDVEFTNVGSGQTYAVANSPTSVNIDLRDCNNNTIVVRNNGLADWANELLPSGRGTITGIYTVFGNTKQLIIRDTSDINFKKDRCAGGGTGSRIRIKDLRDQYTGSSLTIGSGFVQGVVISDVANKNINGQHLVLQDDGSGILLRFKSAINIPLWSEIKVFLSGGVLTEYETFLQVNNLENANVEVIATNQKINPRKLKISELNINTMENTLVSIDDVIISGGTTFAGNKSLNDGTGTLELFTLNSATFANETMPTGKVTLTGIFSKYRGVPQITIRNKDDVSGDTGPPPTNTRISIKDLRSSYSGSPTNLSKDYVMGIVISDIDGKNTNAQNIIVQDEESGIVLRFLSAVNIPLGTEVKVNLAGGQLSEFRTLLQVQFLPNTNIEVINTNKTVTPKTVKVNQITKAMESTLIYIEEAAISGGATYSGTRKVTDSTGEIDMFTNAAATFSGSPIPNSRVKITAFVGSFEGNLQISIRNLDDVKN